MKAAVQFPGSKWVRPGPIAVAQYANKRTALLVDHGDGAPYKLTINLADDDRMEADEVAIKDYSEGEGVLAALVGAGIVSEPLRHVASGWVNVPVVRLLVKFT